LGVEPEQRRRRQRRDQRRELGDAGDRRVVDVGEGYGSLGGEGRVGGGGMIWNRLEQVGTGFRDLSPCNTPTRQLSGKPVPTCSNLFHAVRNGGLGPDGRFGFRLGIGLRLVRRVVLPESETLSRPLLLRARPRIPFDEPLLVEAAPEDRRIEGLAVPVLDV